MLSTDIFTQAVSELLGRASGPFHARLIVQPLVASVLAIRAGSRDARNGSPAFLWGVFTQPAESRRRLLQSAWQDLAKMLVVALTLDVLYTLLSMHAIKPVQTLIVVFLLAIVPYAAVRGLTNRLLRHRRHGAVRTVG